MGLRQLVLQLKALFQNLSPAKRTTLLILIIGIFYPMGELISLHLLRYVGSRGSKLQLRPPCLTSAAISSRE